MGTTAPAGGYTIQNQNTATGKVVAVDGRTCFQIQGERQKVKNIDHTVQISGVEGDRFTFGVWAKSTGALALEKRIIKTATPGILVHKKTKQHAPYQNYDMVRAVYFPHIPLLL